MKLKLCALLFVAAPLTLLKPISVNAQVTGKEPPIRGVWLTNVASHVLDSRKNIQEAVNLCAESGINNIYLVTWNRGVTLYPSQVMKKQFGKLIDEHYAGRDPLSEMIDEAHKKNIKVHAWFEFGFSSSYKQEGGFILKHKPGWAAIDNQGKLVIKNGFEWMNAFDPEVQNFMLSLIKEVVTKYKVDGIQGDDRLPANPSTAGYDKYTVALYKKEHQNLPPPANYKDTAWVTWRSNKLNDFMQRLHQEVKTIKPGMIVSMAPSIFPWSKEEYLQDWPTWVKNHWVDYVFPQVYRYNIEAYTKTLDANLKAIPSSFHNIIFPGILLKVDDYSPSDDLLKKTIEVNRSRGINGEIFFFYEGIKQHRDFFKNSYQISNR